MNQIVKKFAKARLIRKFNVKKRQNERQIFKYKRKMKTNDTVAGVITFIIILIYFYEVKPLDICFGVILFYFWLF